MTTGIVIVVHAPLGAAMRECASHVMGNLDGMLAIHDIPVSYTHLTLPTSDLV